MPRYSACADAHSFLAVDGAELDDRVEEVVQALEAGLCHHCGARLEHFTDDTREELWAGCRSCAWSWHLYKGDGGEPCIVHSGWPQES